MLLPFSKAFSLLREQGSFYHRPEIPFRLCTALSKSVDNRTPIVVQKSPERNCWLGLLFWSDMDILMHTITLGSDPIVSLAPCAVGSWGWASVPQQAGPFSPQRNLAHWGTAISGEGPSACAQGADKMATSFHPQLNA